MATIRLPLRPQQAPLDMLVTAGKDTDVGPRPGSGLENASHLGKGFGITMGILAAVPVVVFARYRNAPQHLNTPSCTTGCNP